MARPQTYTIKTLSTTHLRAIGKVAAEWSSLELTILLTLAAAAKVDFKTATILVGTQNVTVWCEMLKKLTGDSAAYKKRKKKPGEPDTKKKPTELDRLCERINELQRERNEIVHAVWFPTTPLGLPDFDSFPPKTSKSKDKLLATTFPKRGKKTTKFTIKTAKEMLAVASGIAKVGLDLHVWGRPLRQAQTTETPVLSGLLGPTRGTSR